MDNFGMCIKSSLSSNKVISESEIVDSTRQLALLILKQNIK